ncbi:alpha/beta hydrolase [Qipengyuania sp. YG27]|uniref:Alpha/beta hydrolase n=1 Tax=Qipengyuania mesophila TaxID=2867246 RepID=A0ABS7JWJ9_9SPHN|nr:alpha/beta hydrolase-fold protein [Qipengyuania mesophila]MBX7502025.1 alpha/beta hydrolase [Qipengyuania mesophila]
MLKAMISGAALALALAAPAEAQLTDGEPLVVATTYTVKTAILEGESRKVSVRLPTGYDEEPERKYPVVYVLDGGPEQDFEHIAGIAQSRDMNWSFEPFILVGIESVNRHHELAPPVVDPKPYEDAMGATPGGSPDYRRFLREELKPLVEASFRTDGHDAIMGESLAALFVVETLLKDPTLFDDYIAISPSMWWEQMKFGKEAAGYLAKHPAGERRLYLTSASEGDWHREGTERLIAALRTDAPEGLEWAFVEAGDAETHGTLYHPMALDAFRLLYGTPTREYKSYPLIGGPDIAERTEEEQALLDTECTRDNSIAMTPGTAERARESLYYRCLLLDLGPRAREGTLGQ